MDVCYSNTYGTLKQILLFYLNYLAIKIGISCFFFFEMKELVELIFSILNY